MEMQEKTQSSESCNKRITVSVQFILDRHTPGGSECSWYPDMECRTCPEDVAANKKLQCEDRQHNPAAGTANQLSRIK